MVRATAAIRRSCPLSVGLIEGRWSWPGFERVGLTAKATERILVSFSRSADCLGRLLGDAEFEYSGFYALCAIPAIADARPGARLAADDDVVCVHRSRRNQRDPFDLRPTDSGSSGIDETFRQPAGYRLRYCRHLRGAADNQYGRERRLASE